MSLEEAIRRKWAAYLPLTELAPVQRVFAGLAVGNPPLPYVTLERLPTSEAARTSSRTLIDAFVLRIHIWDDRLERAKSIASRLAGLLGGAGFDWSQGVVLDMKRTVQTEVQTADGVWDVTVDFRIRVAQTLTGN